MPPLPRSPAPPPRFPASPRTHTNKGKTPTTATLRQPAPPLPSRRRPQMANIYARRTCQGQAAHAAAAEDAHSAARPRRHGPRPENHTCTHAKSKPPMPPPPRPPTLPRTHVTVSFSRKTHTQATHNERKPPTPPPLKPPTPPCTCSAAAAVGKSYTRTRQGKSAHSAVSKAAYSDTRSRRRRLWSENRTRKLTIPLPPYADAAAKAPTPPFLAAHADADTHCGCQQGADAAIFANRCRCTPPLPTRLPRRNFSNATDIAHAAHAAAAGKLSPTPRPPHDAAHTAVFS